MVLRSSLLLTLLIVGAIAVTVMAIRPLHRGTRAGHPDADYLNSATCVSCHVDHYASWARTYHRRMTQDATSSSVQGDFAKDNTFEYMGVEAHMTTRDGAFLMTLKGADGREQSFSIDRTVGSRRIEQYLSKQNGQFVRLPVAYDLVNRRWMSLNGSFFYPDGADYFKHQAQWDPNCVFCHNVKAQPNFDFTRREFKTEVAELGIACGACHGAAADHVDEASSPTTRTMWRWFSSDETHITNPMKLTSEKSMMVCGHCHGQRIPQPMDSIREILGKGDPYNAGDDLSRFYTPVTRETKIGDYSFANRFWPNGSPRLTAYEYQGVLRSRCFKGGEAEKRISCISCHTMHEGDPKGQLTDENRGDRPCVACHQEYKGADKVASHTLHKADSTGSRCYNCHMPRVVYGVMSVHPSHEITIPAPQMTASDAVPNACNQCHLDKSVNWAIKESQRMWPERYRSVERSPDIEFDVAEGVRALFAGDALTRALAAEAMGGGGPGEPDPRWAAPFLVEAFSDSYPIVRYFAANGLHLMQPQRVKPDYLGSSDTRRESISRWSSWLDRTAQQQAAALAQSLRLKRKDVDIEVGE